MTMRVPHNIFVLSETKFAIESLAAMLQRSPGAVVDLMCAAFLASLPPESRRAIDALKAASDFHTTFPSTLDASAPQAIYNFSRLCFRRDVIEPLGQNDSFRVVTPCGTFQMTKSEFYREFENVVGSRSY